MFAMPTCRITHPDIERDLPSSIYISQIETQLIHDVFCIIPKVKFYIPLFCSPIVNNLAQNFVAYFFIVQPSNFHTI